MSNVRTRLALAFSLFMLLFSLNAGCTSLPGFFKGTLSASPSPTASETPVDGSESGQEIVGRVGSSLAAPAAAHQAP